MDTYTSYAVKPRNNLFFNTMLDCAHSNLKYPGVGEKQVNFEKVVQERNLSQIVPKAVQFYFSCLKYNGLHVALIRNQHLTFRNFSKIRTWRRREALFRKIGPDEGTPHNLQDYDSIKKMEEKSKFRHAALMHNEMTPK